MSSTNALNSRYPTMWHGGDTNPEQWGPETWEEDMRLMKVAGFKVPTLGVFSWVSLEPAEGRYNFEWLDRYIELITENDGWFILATPSAAPPAWMAKKYPEILRVGSDGVRRRHGNRVNYNLASPVYLQKTREMAAILAERYGNHERLLSWHVSNEYGDADYSDESEAQFRTWLHDRFDGDLDKLNKAYWTPFWGHTYTDWDQIEIPGARHGEGAIMGLSLDWLRFVSWQTKEFFLNEANELRRISPHVPVTTNLMGPYEPLDYSVLAPHVDYVSYDSYPGISSIPLDESTWSSAGFRHDVMRGLKPDRPWLLMECTPGISNWGSPSQLMRPGVLFYEGLQAIAHGSDGVLYFQWRQSRGSTEMYHSAVVGHNGKAEARTFKEVAEIGAHLPTVNALVGTTVPSEIALIHDWEARWALKLCPGPTMDGKGYIDSVTGWYEAIRRLGLPMDVVPASADLSRYKVVVAPQLNLLSPGTIASLRAFVEGGGELVLTYLSGYVDETAKVFEGGYLAPLQDVFGLWIEDIDALYPSQSNGVRFEAGREFAAKDFCEIIHPTSAKVLATYTDQFYAGTPAITENSFGKGTATYVAARIDLEGEIEVLQPVLERSKVRRFTREILPAGVSVHVRSDSKAEHVIYLNASPEPQTITTLEHGTITIPPFKQVLRTKNLA